MRKNIARWEEILWKLFINKSASAQLLYLSIEEKNESADKPSSHDLWH